MPHHQLLFGSPTKCRPPAKGRMDQIFGHKTDTDVNEHSAVCLCNLRQQRFRNQHTWHAI